MVESAEEWSLQIGTKKQQLEKEFKEKKQEKLGLIILLSEKIKDNKESEKMIKK